MLANARASTWFKWSVKFTRQNENLSAGKVHSVLHVEKLKICISIFAAKSENGRCAQTEDRVLEIRSWIIDDDSALLGLRDDGDGVE